MSFFNVFIRLHTGLWDEPNSVTMVCVAVPLIGFLSRQPFASVSIKP